MYSGWTASSTQEQASRNEHACVVRGQKNKTPRAGDGSCAMRRRARRKANEMQPCDLVGTYHTPLGKRWQGGGESVKDSVAPVITQGFRFSFADQLVSWEFLFQTNVD